MQRCATEADIAALWALRTRAIRAGCVAHYPLGVIEAWCAAPAPASMPQLVRSGGALLVEQHGQVLGYAILKSDTGEVDALFVDPAHQGRGIAMRLMLSLESLARAKGITRLFLSASLNAVPFYQRAGFVALREEVYPHRSGLGLRSSFMEKYLAAPASDIG